MLKFAAGAKRVISSVGLEHYLDRVGVTGSNPVLPTFFHLSAAAIRFDPINSWHQKDVTQDQGTKKQHRLT